MAFHNDFQKFLTELSTVIVDIDTLTNNYLQPIISNLERYNANYKTYVEYRNKITKYKLELDVLKKTDKYLLDTCIYAYDILFDIEHIFNFYKNFLDNNISTKLTVDMSETFVNAVYESRKNIIVKIDNFNNKVNNTTKWEEITNTFDGSYNEIKNSKINKLVIFLIKRNIDKMSKTDQQNILNIISNQKDALFDVEKKDIKITKNTFVEKNINLSRCRLVPHTVSTNISNCIADILKSENINETYKGDYKDFLDKLKIPIIVIHKSINSIQKPIEFNIRSILNDRISNTAGLSDDIIKSFMTIYDLETPTADFKNGVYYNKYISDYAYIIETLNNKQYRLLEDENHNIKIPKNIVDQFIGEIEERTEKYNNCMNQIIIAESVHERGEYIVKEYEEDKKSLPNLDFVKNNIIKDFFDIYIEELKQNMPSGVKSAKNQIEKLVLQNISKIIYTNILTVVYTEIKNIESNITLALKIASIMEKFRRVFTSNLDKMDILNVFDGDFKEIRYTMINYTKNLLWTTLKEVDTGGLLSNIELSLKEYYSMKYIEDE